MYKIRRPPGRNFFRDLSRHRVPRSLSSITDSKAQDFGCHKQKFPYSWIQQTKNSYTPGSHNKKFPVFLIPHAKISRIPNPTSKNFPYSGSHKQQLPVVQIPQAKIFRILDASNKTPVFPIPKAKIFRIGGIWITLHVAKKGVYISRLIHFYLVLYI